MGTTHHLHQSRTVRAWSYPPPDLTNQTIFSPLCTPSRFTARTMSSEQPPKIPGQGQEPSQSFRSQRSMTKAEKRELQEKQRAAKVAAKASGPTGQVNKSATNQSEGGGGKSSGKQNGKQGSGSGPSTQSQTQRQRTASKVSGAGGETT